MTKKEFIITCKNYAKEYNDEPYVRYNQKEKDKPKVDYFRVQWRSGGRSGGSCWDSGEPSYYPVDGEPEKEMTGLNEMLEKHFRSMSFLTYKKFNKYIKVENYSENEYYGNYTTYTIKSIKFNDVYKVLGEAGLLE